VSDRLSLSRACLQALFNGKKQGLKGDASSLLATTVHTLMRLENYNRAATVFKALGEPLGLALPVATHQHLALRLAQKNSEATDAALMNSIEALELAPTEPSSHLAHGVALLIGTEAEKWTKTAVDALREGFRLRETGAQDSAFPDSWPAGLEANAQHMLGLLLSSHPKEPAKNDQLGAAREAFLQAVNLVPQHTPYQDAR
jgi:hypothetical protein